MPAALRVGLIRRAWPILSAFVAGQGLAQAFNLLSGFLVLRWLSLADYGEYGLAYSFQATVNILVDLGFSTTIIALVGHRTDQPSVIGSYIRAGRSIRLRVFSTLVPASTLVFFYLSGAQHWPLSLELLVLPSIIISIYASGIQAYYSAPLILSRHLGDYYKVQLFGAGIRVVGVALLYMFHSLNVVSAVWTNAVAYVAMAFTTKALSCSLVEEPKEPEDSIRKQMIAYILPNLPSLVFFALQGQVAVFLIATFSKGTGVAQVSALGRLGQLFVFLGAFNSTVLEPWFAKVQGSGVYRRFALAVGSATFISACLVALASAAPGIFLFILGKNYTNLREELVWSIMSSCAWYLVGVVWTAISARRLVFWETTWLNIFMIVIAQGLFISTFGVATPLRAVQLNLAAATASLLVQFFNFIYGMFRGPRVSLTLEQAA